MTNFIYAIFFLVICTYLWVVGLTFLITPVAKQIEAKGLKSIVGQLWEGAEYKAK